MPKIKSYGWGYRIVHVKTVKNRVDLELELLKCSDVCIKEATANNKLGTGPGFGFLSDMGK